MQAKENLANLAYNTLCNFIHISALMQGNAQGDVTGAVSLVTDTGAPVPAAPAPAAAVADSAAG